jgi:superfamily II DNA or RNA helicase
VLSPVTDFHIIEENPKYLGRLHRLHDNKRVVQAYDYIDANVLMLARMYERRLKGHAAIGYQIQDDSTPSSNPAARVKASSTIKVR